MEIVIDARFWGSRHTGLGVYTKNLVLHLAGIDFKNSYVLLVRNEAKQEILNLKLPENFKFEFIDVQPYSFAEQIILPLKIYQLSPDLVHFTSISLPMLYFGKYVVTIHDLTRHQYKGIQTTTRNPIVYWLKHFGYLFLTKWVTYSAKKIIVPSNIVKEEFSDVSKIKVIYEAATLVDNPKTVPGLPKLFAVYTGNAYPHKNLPRLIDSWKDVYAQTRCVLVLVCGRNIFAQRIKNLVEEKKASEYVIFLGYLTDEELVYTYRHAQLFVFPTLAEGFGLPGLEAMRHRLPLVCSDIQVLKEIYAEAAVYFNPTNIADMTQKIVMVLNDRALRKKLTDRGKEQADKYSWNKTAVQTLNVYESCLSL